MFIFNILFSLINLPFVLLGMAFRLVGISTHIFLWPLKIFARHTVLCLVIAAGVIFYLALKSDPHAVDSLKPKTPAVQQPHQVHTSGPDEVPIIQPVSKREDGDSKFATDLYELMTDPEKIAYSQNFYSALNTTKNGEAKVWTSNNINGAIRPVDTFLNNTGSTCRRFGEVLKVHTIEQRLTGIACVKADGTWCKLKSTSTPACNLGHEAGAFEGITRAIGDLF